MIELSIQDSREIVGRRTSECDDAGNECMLNRKKMSMMQELLILGIDKMRKDKTTIPCIFLQMGLLMDYITKNDSKSMDSPFISYLTKNVDSPGSSEDKLFLRWHDTLSSYV